MTLTDDFTQEKNKSFPQEYYPLGMQYFPQIIKDGYVYVDKTAFIAAMLHQRGKYYFLSRPRRFGKSLLMSTLEAYFEGRRELFKGLALDRLTDDWQAWPVVHLDLSLRGYTSLDGLREILMLQIDRYAKKFGVELVDGSPSARFNDLLFKVFERTGKQVVVLIDEYDKPLIDNLDNEALCDEFRGMLKGFYGNLKSCDPYIRFGMLTGITRFSKLSIFSDLNNLNDISMVDKYAEICGITEREMVHYFPGGIQGLAERRGLTFEQTVGELRRRYDGYRFTEYGQGVYNPFSLLSSFTNEQMKDYWYETGAPSFLVRRIRRDNWSLPALERTFAQPSSLADIHSTDNPIPLLFQTGYLTIKAYDPATDEYRLNYPNIEVRNGMIKSLFAGYVRGGLCSDFDVLAFRADLMRGDVDSFMARLETMVANIPADHRFRREFEFQNVFYIIFMMVGECVQTEVNVGGGRCDMVVHTARNIYVFEFKYNKTVEAAMAQLRARGYAEAFRMDPRTVTLIAANYSCARNTLSWRQAPAFP